ncbi:hypothetical protein BC830DRAFT_1152753 [Chytriomyces sp. MP71]|nr:hypothetical protein BC830DRAFT_1152753 [Chytriomyces sp. MP71]
MAHTSLAFSCLSLVNYCLAQFDLTALVDLTSIQEPQMLFYAYQFLAEAAETPMLPPTFCKFWLILEEQALSNGFGYYSSLAYSTL